MNRTARRVRTTTRRLMRRQRAADAGAALLRGLARVAAFALGIVAGVIGALLVLAAFLFIAVMVARFLNLL